jgi:hypothetical protein
VSTLTYTVLERFVACQRNSIQTKELDSDNLVVTIPARHCSVKLAVTRRQDGRYFISDMGRTLEKVKAAGRVSAKRLMKEISEITKQTGIYVWDGYLLSDSPPTEVGRRMHAFVEIGAMVSEARYLAACPNRT